jgi:succinate dehydrogenase / fumarate reductase, flavoprotein subunit
MWDNVGMSRNEKGLNQAVSRIKEIKKIIWKNVKVLGENEEMNQSLEKAGRVADFLELGELIAKDASAQKRIVRRTFQRRISDRRK